MHPERACDACRALGLWGRLSTVKDIYTIYERNFGGQYAEGLPAYLSTILEADFGPIAKHPQRDDDETFFTYDRLLQATVAKLLPSLGSKREYAALGAPASVHRFAQYLLSTLDSSPRSRMLRPFFRQRFEASTGIDCSDFFDNGNLRPQVVTRRLENWLASSGSQKFVPRERYFFGHHIPR